MAVKLIHKNSGVKNKPVLPSQIEYGEISINWHDSGPFIQVKDASNEIVRVGGVVIQPNQPALAQKGAFWLSGTELYLYNGTAWILISGGGGGTGGDFIACSDGGLVFDATDQCWQIDEAWLLEWAQNNSPGSVDPGDGELTIVDADGNTLGVFTANQSGDVEIVLPPNSSFSGDYDDLINKPAAPGDGELLLKDANDDTLGTFSANQSGNVEIVLPAGFSGNWDELQNKPVIGDGDLVIKDAADNTLGTFTANQTGSTEVVIPAGFSGDYDDLTNKPAAPGDGKLTVKDSADNVLGEFTANQTGDTEVVIPAGGAGGAVQWDDIEGKPDCFPACRPDPGWSSLKWWLNVIVVEEDACQVAMQNREDYPEFEIWNVRTGEQLDIDDMTTRSRKKRDAQQDPEGEASGFDGGGYYYYHIIYLDPGDYIIGFRNPVYVEGDDHNSGITFEESPKDFKIGVLTNTFEMETAQGMFRSCEFFTNLGSAFPVGFETHNCKDMSYMFSYASAFNQPVVQWNVSKVTTMEAMFRGTNVLNQDIQGWDTGKVTNMDGMFKFAESFNGSVRDWNTGSVETMNSMFQDAFEFTGKDIASWDVSSVTNMGYMFYGCAKLIARDIGREYNGWARDTGNCSWMGYMFLDCTVFNEYLGDWCVPLIGSEPLNFATNSGLTNADKPKWGTCP